MLEEAVVGQPFIKAAEKALKVDIDDFVAARALPSGAPIRAKVIPGFKKILATFDKVDVPEGQSAVADKVRAALKEVSSKPTRQRNLVSRAVRVRRCGWRCGHLRELVALAPGVGVREGRSADQRGTGRVHDLAVL